MVSKKDRTLRGSTRPGFLSQLVRRARSVRPSYPEVAQPLILPRCALIHCHRPDLLDYNKLDKVERLGLLIGSVNLLLAVIDGPPWKYKACLSNSC